MGLKKYLKQVSLLFSPAQRACDKKKRCLRLALHHLKLRKQAIKRELERELSEKSRKQLKDELKVINAQREKGLRLLKELQRKSP